MPTGRPKEQNRSKSGSAEGPTMSRSRVMLEISHSLSNRPISASVLRRKFTFRRFGRQLPQSPERRNGAVLSANPICASSRPSGSRWHSPDG